MSNEMKRYASEDCVDSKINSAFEKHNTFTIEYAEPIKISLADIPIFNKVISSGTATYGTVEIVDGQTFIYTPTTYLLGVETVVLTFDDNTTYDVCVNPADNIYYDASFFNIADATGWSYVEDETGSYVVATMDTGTNPLVPHFVGTGFTLMAKHSLDDGAAYTLLVQCVNKGNLLVTSTTNSINGYNLPAYARDILEHDTWDVRIVRNKSNPEGAKLELSGIRIYNTIYDESSPYYISIADRVKKSNNDTNGTATSVIYLTYNTETKAFERTLLNNSTSNSQIYHAFEINKTGDNPKVYVSANAQSSKSTLSSVDSYNDNVAVSHGKSVQVNDGVMKFYPLKIVNYNDKNYVLVSSFTGTTNYDMIKCVDCEIVTQADQAAVDAFVEDVIRIANGALIATVETTKQLEEAIGGTVKTTAQELTEEQQNQARANIGVYHDTRVLVEKYVNALSGAEINATADWNVGEEVVVFIDGVENKYTVQSATEEIEGNLWTETYIGNNPFDASGDNGFVMCTYPAVGMVYIFNATEEPHTYGIYAMEAVKIPDKYLNIKPKFNVYSSSYDTSEIPSEQLDAIVIQIPVMSGAHVDEEIVCSPSGNLHLRHDYVKSRSLGTIEINPSTFAVTEVRTFPLNDIPSSLSYLTVIDTSRYNKTTVSFSLSGGRIVNSSVGYIEKYFLQTCAYINGYLFAFSTNEHLIGESDVAWTVDVKRLM